MLFEGRKRTLELVLCPIEGLPAVGLLLLELRLFGFDLRLGLRVDRGRRDDVELKP
jgi:hypothetical protein